MKIEHEISFSDPESVPVTVLHNSAAEAHTWLAAAAHVGFFETRAGTIRPWHTVQMIRVKKVQGN